QKMALPPPGWRSLPTEVLTEIIQNTSKADQVALCRVSHLFQTLSLPVLYRVVRLVARRGAPAFCEALVANPERAKAVRSFTVWRRNDDDEDESEDEDDDESGDEDDEDDVNATVNVGKYHGRDLPESFPLLLMSSMNLMVLLDNLVVDFFVFGKHDLLLLEQGTFPRLTRCRFVGHIYRALEELEAKSVAFLARHPTLAHVHLGVMPPSPTPLHPAALPALWHYTGPAALIANVTSVAGLREAELDWQHSNRVPAVGPIIAALASCTDPSNPAFYSSHFALDPVFDGLMSAISNDMPHTSTLRVAVLAQSRNLPDNHVILACLPRFTGLVHLAIEWYFCGRGRSANFTEEDGRAIVEGWGNACPGLQACCIVNSGDFAWRKLNGSWQALPVEDFREMAGIKTSPPFFPF
ncbi:hypothetical protein C8R46DRAFT_1064858, partial [Mycena filopes]